MKNSSNINTNAISMCLLVVWLISLTYYHVRDTVLLEKSAFKHTERIDNLADWSGRVEKKLCDREILFSRLSNRMENYVECNSCGVLVSRDKSIITKEIRQHNSSDSVTVYISNGEWHIENADVKEDYIHTTHICRHCK